MASTYIQTIRVGICVAMIGICLFFGVFTVFAQDESAPNAEQTVYKQQEVFAQSAGIDTVDNDPRTIVALSIQVLLSVLGVALLAYATYGGYVVLMAGGDSEQINLGKQAIVRSAVGACIIVSSYALSSFIAKQIMSAEFQGSNSGLNNGFVTQPVDTGTTPNDPFFERDRNFCTGITCDPDGVFVPTHDNGSGWFLEVN